MFEIYHSNLCAQCGYKKGKTSNIAQCQIDKFSPKTTLEFHKEMICKGQVEAIVFGFFRFFSVSPLTKNVSFRCKFTQAVIERIGSQIKHIF